MMSYYVDLGAQRVQEWIMATPRLMLLRGASSALKKVTARAAVEKWLAAAGLEHDCKVAEEAGEKDGIVVVWAANEVSAAAAARVLSSELRKALPRVQWAGWWAEADSYLVAHDRAREGHPSVRRLVSHPATYEFPVLEHCRDCRQEAVLAGAQRGSDCAARERYAELPLDLIVNVRGTWPTGLDFNDFAARGGLAPGMTRSGEVVGRKDLRNHLALVKADGNKIGQVFEQIATHADKLPGLVRCAVNDLNEATINAVEAAGQAVTDTNACIKGVLPHYVGGDDVLVSVPASEAWRFAVQLATAFELVRDAWRRSLEIDLRADGDEGLRASLMAVIDEVSLGVGVVFAHASHPLAQSLQAADRALREAKLATAGTASAIGWVDLTAEGVTGASVGGRWRQVIEGWEAREQMRETFQLFEAERALFDVDPAGRARLTQLVRESADDETIARERALQWARVNNRNASLQVLIEDDVLRLLPLLSRARWWPKLRKEAECASK